MTRSTIDENQAGDGGTGGVYFVLCCGAAGGVGGGGGGIATQDGTLVVDGSTIVGNTAGAGGQGHAPADDAGQGGDGAGGGGISVIGGSVQVTNIP